MNNRNLTYTKAVVRLMNHGPIIFLRLDESGRVTEANATARNLMGNEIIGLAADEIFLTFDAPLDIASLRTHDDQIHQFNVPTVAGLPETLCCHFLAVGDDTLIFSGVDPTETGRLRSELITLNNELSALTRSLQKKNHQLAELNRLKNQFLDMAAHDLRKPVSSILTYTEFLMDEAADALTEEHSGFLKTIYASTALMRGLIDDFLDISLIESGRFHLRLEPASVREPAERSLALNRLPAQRKGIFLRLDMNGSFPLIPMDGHKIEQVFNNLISNAIDHAPSDTEVVVKIFHTNEKIAVTVIDAGPGISEADAERLFMPYVSNRKSASAETKNMGMGLAISKKIVEAHQGNIWVESRPGQGAAFSFHLPINPTTKNEPDDTRESH